ncbi:hypothetical protein PR202_gn00870 [Eleusine coracana subsp. coracana]|uniref:Uncharacterized protein n=1 Tax=Eleusine coracana subsp. coracana TaxID=191504 RepID=A0AAV5G0R9_ELECO|nr:hypothetical protein PR202_gn00870 [Eleusine coracana subsp. coracana]
MGYLPSLGGKAAHLVSDLATVILNPVSERERQHRHPAHLPEDTEGKETLFADDHSDKDSNIPNGPDTSSFRAFSFVILCHPHAPVKIQWRQYLSRIWIL